MTAFRSLSLAMGKGFFRDKMALFFALLFPLMFLVLFGGLFANQGISKPAIIQVGRVALLDDAPPAQQKALRQSLEITKSGDEKAAIAKVRKGDADAAVTADGDNLVLHYSRADQVKSAVVQGTFQGIVQGANVAASGRPPKFSVEPEQVEDRSLKTIQYVTPGLLGWAVATGATFGAAANLVVWRKFGLLRRLRLAPISTQSIVLARVAVALVIAAVQAVIFIGLGSVAFGLRLTGFWWMCIPLLAAGTVAFMAIGLFSGSISKTEEGATGLANFIVLPMAFLSGSFFPLDGAPLWLRGVSNVLPLKHLNDGMLDVMVRGQGPSAVVVPIVILLAFAAVLTAISSRLFRWDAT